MMSLKPDKRVVAALEATDPLLLVCSVLDTFMYLSLTKIPALPLAKSVAGRETRRSESQFFSNITTDSSQKRYGLRYKLLDLSDFLQS